jgi:hypothetical protein
MYYRCLCGYEATRLDDLVFHLFSRTPHNLMRSHARIIWTPFVSGV